ncbi:MAG: D-alanyl-D-alanine carboxypeptidase [Oscillospiraceae bacterium]|nr:D-alanyl-D-alanine carboxypeptidase [Oscillospiraceae bacterium]
MKKLTAFVLLLLFIFLLPAGALAADAADSIGDVEAAAAVAMDADTGDVLFSWHGDDPREPASIAKMMTALLVLEAAERGEISLSDRIVVTESMLEGLPSDASRMRVGIVSGEEFTVEQLLYAHMVSSDCMASRVLGCFLGGTNDSFCRMMDRRAEELGCTDTHFTDPSGYPDPAMTTTARSLAVIARECMTHEAFRGIVSTVRYTLPATNLNGPRELENTNRLLLEEIRDGNGEPVSNPYYSPLAIGIKTGFSTPAGSCLASCFDDGERRVIIVVLGTTPYSVTAEDGSAEVVMPQYGETLRIADAVFHVFSLQKMEEEFSALSARRFEEVDSTEKEYAAVFSAVHDRDPGLQRLAERSWALTMSGKERVRYAVLAMAVILVLSVPSGLILRRRRR